MVYKTKFLKQPVVIDYVPPSDGSYTWELSDQTLAAIWITIKGKLYTIDQCIDDYMASITNLDLWFGGFNVVHYEHGIKALTMNSKLKGAHPYLVQSSQIIDDLVGVTFPILLGAPYLNEQMALPESLNNRKKLTLTVDIATAAMDALELEIAEVIMPEARPLGFIKQEEQTVTSRGTGDHDVWLQTNWDLLKLLLYSPTAIAGATQTATLERAGLEINDFAFGYKWVQWEILHGELMDELEGLGFTENHQHLAAGATANTGMPFGIDHWIQHYAQMDFFYNYDLKWRAPLAGASTAKLKYNAGVDEAFGLVFADYVPTSKVA